MKFNDGTAFDAAAVKLSVERAQALKKAASLYVKPIVKVETPSPTTVVFHLDKPNNAFLAGLRFLLIVSPKAVQDNDKGGDKAQGWLRDHTAGTGPYIAREVGAQHHPRRPEEPGLLARAGRPTSSPRSTCGTSTSRRRSGS